MKLIGLTGGIASGKSTVADILRRMGAAIVDADVLSREVVEPGQQAWQEIVNTFGADVLQADRKLDRQKLRKIIFDNPGARKQLEVIIHPRVRALAEQRIAEHRATGFELIVYEVPLLFEGKIHEWLRPVILVACDLETQRRRVEQRDNVSSEAAQKIIDAQMSLDEKRKLADYTIENNGSLAELERQVHEVIDRIKAT
ncbi:MAG: dephospho-CoA kinase [Deltaproteobacteria bacterium]|nr:dephospho-CoA kinase [Deltaproteobacteria bacterium]